MPFASLLNEDPEAVLPKRDMFGASLGDIAPIRRHSDRLVEPCLQVGGHHALHAR